MTQAAPLIRLAQVVKVWTGREFRFEVAVDELELAPGATLGVVGESGSGKSTLLDMLALALSPDAAGVFEFTPAPGDSWDIAEIWRRGDRGALARLRAQNCGYVLQTGGLLPFITVGENISLPQRIVGRRQPDLVDELAERLGLADHLRRMPGELSVGQRQRVAIARALSHRPCLLLADEPTASVQASMASEIMSLLVEHARLFGAALVVATHSPELLKDYDMPSLVCTPVANGPAVRSTFRRATPGAHVTRRGVGS